MATPRAYGGIAFDDRLAERRQRLVDAAYTLLAEGGPAAITVTGVCKEARLTARYFYEHFASRDVLLSALTEAEADRIITLGLTAALGAAPDPQARGEAAVRALLDALEKDHRATRISRERGGDEVVLRMRAEIAGRLTASFAEHAAIMWPQAIGYPERVTLASSLTVGGVLQIITDWLSSDGAVPRDELIRIAARFVIATGDAVLA